MSIEVEKDEGEFVENIYDPALEANFSVHARRNIDRYVVVNPPVRPGLASGFIQEISEVTNVVPGDDTFCIIPHLEWISERMNTAAVPNPPIYTRIDPYHQIFYNDEDLVLVEGASGCGKTTAAWAYFLDVANNPAVKDRFFVWISLALRRKIVVTSGIALVETFDPFVEDAYHIISKVGEINEGRTVRRKCPPTLPTVLVVDGITNDNAKCLDVDEWLRVGISHIRLLTSQQGLHKVSRMPWITTQFAVVTISPWTFEEYCNICSNDIFFASVRDRLGGTEDHGEYTPAERIRLVKFKYFYAGYSARFMFEYTIPEVKRAIRTGVNQIPDLSSFVKFHVGPESPLAVNKLVVTIESRKCFVSEYLARYLTNVADDLIIGMLNVSALTARNPAMDGWALEADFLFSLKSSNIQRRVYNIIFNEGDPVLGGLNDSYNVSGNVIYFYCNVPHNLTVDQIQVNQWFAPEVHNQGGYDCVQVILLGGVLMLRFVQVTRNMKHELKVHYMRIFLNKVNEVLRHANRPEIQHIQIVLLIPTEKCSQAPNPQLSQQWRLTGQPRNPPPHIEYCVVAYQRLRHH